MTDDLVGAAYSVRADEYTTLLGSISAVTHLDRQLLSGWAARCRGPILDAGCGPGHWTDFLAEQGVEIEGVDLPPSPISPWENTGKITATERLEWMSLNFSGRP